MYLSDVLKIKGAHTVVAGDDIKVAAAVAVMCDSHVGALIITGPRGAIAGILTERDILRRFAEHGADLGQMRVSAIMTRKVETAGPDARVDDVLDIMTRKRFRHMPVVHDGELIGIVSIGDLVKATLHEKTQEAESLRQYITS